MRLKVYVAAAVLLSTALAACGGDDSGSSDTTSTPPEAATTVADAATESTTAAPSGNTDDLIVGHVEGITGAQAFYDVPVDQGAQIAADEINAAGGIAGRKIKIITADNESDASKTGAAAEKLLGEGAEVLITPADANLGGPAALAAQDKGIVAMGAAGGSTFGLEGMGDQVFNLHAGNATEASVLAQAAIDKGWKSPYLLVDTSNDYTTGLCDLFETLYNENATDGKIAGKDTFVQTDQSVTSQVNRIKDTAGADVIVLCSYPPGGASVVRQLRSAGIDTPILTGVPFDGKFWIEAVPDVTDVYHTSVGSLYGDDPRPEVNEFWAKYREKYGEPETTYPLFGYIAMQILAQAGEQTGGVTTDGKLADAIETITDADFILGPTSYSPTCHAPLGRAMTLMRWENGVDHFNALVTPTAYPQIGC